MPIPKAILDSAAALFSIKDAQLEPLHGGHFNQVYRFTQDSRSFVLRFTPISSEINLEEMQAILEWMQYLAEHGASVPSPIQSTNSILIENIEFEDQSFLATMLEAADGILSEDMRFEQWSNELYRTLGSTLGKIHALAAQFNPSQTANKRPEWDDTPNNFNPESDQGPHLKIINAEREKVADYLKSLPKENDNWGLIHGDLHLGNFFIDVIGNKITIFDFDDYVYGWFTMDIATLIFDFPVVYPATEDNEPVENFITHLLNGYFSEKPTSKFWIKQLPYFLKLLEIGIYLLVYKEYVPEDNQSWVGKFMSGRKARIENGIPYLDIDFEQINRSP